MPNIFRTSDEFTFRHLHSNRQIDSMAQQPRFYASLQGEVRTLLLVTGLISAGAALTAAYFAVAKPGPRSSKMSREALIELLKTSIENGLVARVRLRDLVGAMGSWRAISLPAAQREAMATVVSAERSGKAATVSSVGAPRCALTRRRRGTRQTASPPAAGCGLLPRATRCTRR